ncbi:kininogen-1 [Orycteropus afer afer]|uniref:Kininogen-1 n=1 Tax=Orycteropus afer afer TaxID=1230840 RepID=A0A8B6ZES6_ORYAF|nr:kininogen-1 [Orycteropus afer afer]
MKLITIIFFCSRLLPSFTQESFSNDIDCNNPDVFKAVDAALKKYNDQNQSGNQFVLYRVTQVTKTDGSGTFYSFKYQIKEGDCPFESGKTWQECDYKKAEGAATGECTAIVKKKNTKFIISTQTCHITPAEGPVETAEYNCLGCVHPISTDSPDLEPVLQHAVQHFNNNTEHSYLFALHKVKSALRQVVAGWNFEISYSIVQTNCSKENFLFLTPDCKSLLNGDTGECRDFAYMDPQLRIASFTQNCDLYPAEEFVPPPIRICPGCPKEIAIDSPELEEVLNHSIAKLNAENNGTFYFKIDSVKNATVQVVAGKKFSIVFIARETTCSKESNEELTKSCATKDVGKTLECNAEVHVVPWEKKIYPTVNCRSIVTESLRKRPPGFSPFRSVPWKQEETEVTTVSPPHTSMAPVQDEERDPGKEQGPTHGHGWGHEKQIKHDIVHGHKHKHDQGHVPLGGQDHTGHGHQRGHGLAHGHKHKHGHGHGKHRNKGKNHGKHNGWRTEHLASSSEDSTTSSAQTQEKTEGPTPPPSLTQPGVTVTFSDFQDSDLIATVMPNIPPLPTENDEDWIPDVQIEPNSFSFDLISDFPETTSPNCPGRPWKPVNGINPTVEVKEFPDFDLSDALS